MGCAHSKSEMDESLRLCKERRRLVNQAIDFRCALASAHIAYIQSLRHFGIAMRRFAEADVLAESSSSPISPSSSSPSQISIALNSPFPNQTPTPILPPDYIKSSDVNSIPILQNSMLVDGDFADRDKTESGSWDFFYPAEDGECLTFSEENEGDRNSDNARGLVDCRAVDDDFFESGGIQVDFKCPSSTRNSNSSEEEEEEEGGLGPSGQSPEREDPSKYITHRAKDFLSSTKYIEHRFFRASDAGKDVTRLLEVNKLPARYVEWEEPKSVKKSIIWRQSISSLSYSSKKLLFTSSKDDISDSGPDFLEEFFMFAGSHSLTLDRLYAWERKLYEEVKASQYVRRDYDKKCKQLGYQSAKDASSHVIDKTRSAVKDLHSRVQIAIQTIDSISKRIERMRDEELLPQLLELIHGFVKMWKEMLECHHEQYITISLAYHWRGVDEEEEVGGEGRGERRRLMLAHLEKEIECFGLSFINWTNSHSLYVDSLNTWLHHCILLPPPCRTNRRPFSPRRALAPPIFVLLRDWAAGIRLLPSQLLHNSVSAFSTQVHSLLLDKEQGEQEEQVWSNVHAGMVKVMDRLTQFSEAAVKMYEDVLYKNKVATLAYSRPTSSS